MKRIAQSLVFLASLASSGAAFATTNLVTNGDFSSPDVGQGYTFVPNAGGWTEANDYVEVGYSPIYGLPCAVSSCQNAEILATKTPDILEQTISNLTIGAEYTISWLYGGRAGSPASAVATFGNDVLTTDSGSSGFWSGNSYKVVATSSTETLSFAATAMSGCGSCGAEITDVSVSAVPEPATWAMMLFGFAGVSFVGYRQTKRKTDVTLSVA